MSLSGGRGRGVAYPGALAALTQTNVKRLLAYSSISQGGYSCSVSLPATGRLDA